MIGINIEMPTYCYDCPCHNGENGQCNVTGEYNFDKRPFDCPLCDVNEVRHGHWEHDTGIWSDFEMCSLCKKWTKSSIEYDYCPNCAAKMDEERDI